MESKSLSSAIRLYNHLLNSFWNEHALVGPDPDTGVMLELRIYRFIKSYLSFINWSDNYCFLQAQGYWIRSNWALFDITGNIGYRKVAIACSEHITDQQKKDGSWEHPLKSWKYLGAPIKVTVEGTWASLGLLETFKWTKESKYLNNAMKWHDFLINKIGFQPYLNSLSINHFDMRARGMRIPNNTSLVLWFLAELYELENDEKFLRFNDRLIRFIQLAQKNSGELKYAIEREHYLCYHYNAFEFLDLFNYYRITNNEKIRIVLEKLAKFLSAGVTEIGSIKCDCFRTFPEFIYFSAAVGAALIAAASIGFKGYEKHIEYIHNYLFEKQRRNGSFPFSTHDAPYLRNQTSHGIFTDNRSYPRELSYILQHLLCSHIFSK